MKAAQISAYGDASVIQINEIDQPAIQPSQVLVEVQASSVNPFDSKLRAGMMQQMIPLTFPTTLGGDIAGIVSKLGDDVANLAVGDKVYGQANAVAGNSGAFAEYAATATGQIAKAPANLDLQQAASLPLVGVSALQALTEHIGLQTGQKILITGGAGGIGSIAIQIAKHIGAIVTTTATGGDIDLAKQLGADEVIDYKAKNLADLPAEFDSVFDTIGGDMFDTTLRVLKPGGTSVSMAGQVNESLASELGVTAISQSTKVTTSALDALRELVEANVVTPQIGKVFSLDQIVEAFQAKENDHITGKIVISIKD